MAQLHEVLAVEGDREGTAKKILEETIKTFSSKPTHFLGHFRRTEPLTENVDKEAAEGYVPEPDDTKELVETVDGKLNYMWESWGNYLNVVTQKERTNQIAKADLVVDGVTLATDVPATLLLGLENRLKLIRTAYEAIPTNDPGKTWVWSEQENRWVTAEDDVKLVTNKVHKFTVMVQPTDKHPAQVHSWMEDAPVAKRFVKHWSGMYSPAQKSDRLRRVDKLIQAVKQARQRANTATVDQNGEIASKLQAFITTGKVK